VVHIAVDSVGNLFIADASNHRIRKVDTAGIITTVAGKGIPGYCGDNGPATNACISVPSGVAVDTMGNLFIADTGNSRIRKVDTAGIITTVAGNGTVGFCGDNGPATAACIDRPNGIAWDASGELFIADTANSRIRKVDGSGVITTVAGNGTDSYCGDSGPATSACLYNPHDVAVDSAGNLFIADRNNHRIRKVDVCGTITTVAGTGALGFCGDNGLATSACIYDPWGVGLDGSGTLFIADSLNQRIRRVGMQPVISGGGLFCIAGISTGTDFSWFIDLDGGGIIGVDEPVENTVVNTVPPGQGESWLAAAFIASVNANPKSAPACLSAAISTNCNCFSIVAKGCVGGTNPGVCCVVHADCAGGGICLSVTPELYVGPVNNPTSCKVTSSGCSYNPTIATVPSTPSVPILNGWGVVALTLGLLCVGRYLVRRRPTVRSTL
jgi:sugar lactone lactonase YvrE